MAAALRLTGENLQAGLDRSGDGARCCVERTKRRLGKQRGGKVARVELARELTVAIWHMLTRQEPFRTTGPTLRLVA